MTSAASSFDFALLWTENTYALDGKIMGRQSAGAGLLRAIAAQAPTALVAATPTRADAESCARAIARAGAADCGVEWAPLWGDGAALERVGALYRPDPNIAREAWRRAPRGRTAYSLLGVTHTLCTSVAQRAIADLLTAPVEPWDALICTSTVAKAAARSILEAQADHLKHRLGAQRFTEPQLPVIPLGVHPDDFAFTPGQRAAARTELGLHAEEVVVLYAGRPTPAKANAAPMLMALQAAAKGRRVTLVQAGIFPDPRMAEYYRAEAAQIAPSVRMILVDGADPGQFRAAWTAADMFTSLVDSFQETFGITPLEAMAASLPVVVSDWNGYKDTVRHQVDGFRIPTLALPPGRMDVFSEQYADGYTDLDRALLQTASYVAVDIRAAAEAFDQLISDPAARRRMGCAGRARVEAQFSWAGILQRYRQLCEELRQHRSHASGGAQTPYTDPAAQSFFSTFSSYPSAIVGPHDSFRMARKQRLDAASTLQLFSAAASRAAPPLPLLEAVLSAADAMAWLRLPALQARLRRYPPNDIEAAVIWLVKFGLLEHRA